jgi:hypothetical protein
MSVGFLLIHAKPHRISATLLSWALFVTGIAAYLYVAAERHRDNAEERVTPTIAQMARGMYDAALKPAEDDEQTATDGSLLARFQNSMLWKDTKATSRSGGAAGLAHGPVPVCGRVFSALRAVLR